MSGTFFHAVRVSAYRQGLGGNMEFSHTIEAPARRASVHAVPAVPRLSRRAGLWAVAFSFLAVAAFSTDPSPLYGLFGHQEHLSSLTITFAYAVYAVGVVVSLVLAGHVSDWYGRRAVLLPAIAAAVVAAVLFLFWRSLAGLLAARVLTGVALGAAVATATAYIADLDAGPRRDPPGRNRGHGRQHRRPGVRAADRRPARPRRSARAHPPLPGLPRRPRAGGPCRRPRARGPSAH